jgi:ribosomal protein L12E/L44/L45/RPP1/RPP2
MPITSLSELTASQKEDMVAALSCLVVGDGEMTAETLQAVATASGNSLSDPMAALFANVVSKSEKGIKTFTPGPGGGGGGGGGGAAAGGAAAATVEKVEEVEEEAEAPAGGGGLFGDDGGGGGGDY